MTHICVGNLTIIGSDNGLSPGRCEAIIKTNVGILLIGPWGKIFSEILIGIQTFPFKKMHLKMWSVKWRPLRLGLNVLRGPVLSCRCQKMMTNGLHGTMYVYLLKNPIRLYHSTINTYAVFYSSQYIYKGCWNNRWCACYKVYRVDKLLIPEIYPRNSPHSLNRILVYNELKIWSPVLYDDWQ